MLNIRILPLLHATLVLLWLPFWVDLSTVQWGLKCFWPDYPRAVSGSVIPVGIPSASISRSGTLYVQCCNEMALPVSDLSEVTVFFRDMVGNKNQRAVVVRAPRETPYSRIDELFSIMKEAGVQQVYLFTELPAHHAGPNA